MAILETFNTTNFDQSVEIAVRLGVDTTQADQLVRGLIVLPHGIGKTLRVLVFAKGGQDGRGQGRRAAPIRPRKSSSGWTGFDVCVAAPRSHAVWRQSNHL